jgi:hypothetical protein
MKKIISNKVGYCDIAGKKLFELKLKSELFEKGKYFKLVFNFKLFDFL